MGEAEAAPDEAAVAEQAPHVFRVRVGRDVEVLGLPAEQQVAHPATDEERLVAGLAQAIHHLQRVARDIRARDVVFRPGYDPRGCPHACRRAGQSVSACVSQAHKFTTKQAARRRAIESGRRCRYNAPLAAPPGAHRGSTLRSSSG